MSPFHHRMLELYMICAFRALVAAPVNFYTPEIFKMTTFQFAIKFIQIIYKFSTMAPHLQIFECAYFKWTIIVDIC